MARDDLDLRWDTSATARVERYERETEEASAAVETTGTR